jgi:hypothetical protein
VSRANKQGRFMENEVKLIPVYQVYSARGTEWMDVGKEIYDEVLVESEKRVLYHKTDKQKAFGLLVQ